MWRVLISIAIATALLMFAYFSGRFTFAIFDWAGQWELTDEELHTGPWNPIAVGKEMLLYGGKVIGGVLAILSVVLALLRLSLPILRLRDINRRPQLTGDARPRKIDH